MRIVLLGAPGSGKGTQAKRIAETYGIPHIPMNDLVRAAVTADTPLGRQIKAATENGQPVTDDILLGIIQERLAQPDAGPGFILDGFPRNVAQAEALAAMTEQSDRPLEGVLLITVDFETLLQRFTGRRTCVSCGKTYNIYTSPSRLDDRCDECGGNLRHRADEKEETISNRLRVHEAQTSPVVEYYRKRGLLHMVQGAGEIEEIFREMKKVLDSIAVAGKTAAKKRAAPAAKGAEAKPGAATRVAKAAPKGETKSVAKVSRPPEKKAVDTAKRIVKAAGKEAKAAIKAVGALPKKAVGTARKLLAKAEKTVETKKTKPAAAKQTAPKKAVPAKSVKEAKAPSKKVAVKKTATKAVAVKAAAPKKTLKSVVLRKGAVKKKAVPVKVSGKTADRRR